MFWVWHTSLRSDDSTLISTRNTVTLELGFFASRTGRSEMQCAALGFPYVVNLKMDNSLK